ncbi:MAG: hypothetical protein ABFD04_14205 [Syntrophomonas sp.]
MERAYILERLVSIKSNAQHRAYLESKGNIECQNEMKAYFLETGIGILIMEIQNTILADYRTANSVYPELCVKSKLM